MDIRNFDYGSQPSDSKEGLMAKRSLLTMAKDLYNLYMTLEDTDDLPEWCHYKLATSRKDLSDITDYLTSKVMKHCLDREMSQEDLRLEIKKSMIDNTLSEGFFDFFKKRKSDIEHNAVQNEILLNSSNYDKYKDNHLFKFLYKTDQINKLLYNDAADVYINNNIYSTKKGNEISSSYAYECINLHIKCLESMKDYLNRLKENYSNSPDIAANYIGILNSQSKKLDLFNWIDNYEDYFIELGNLDKEINNLVYMIGRFNPTEKGLSRNIDLHYDRRYKGNEDKRRQTLKFKNQIKSAVRQSIIKIIDNILKDMLHYKTKYLSATYALEFAYETRRAKDLESQQNSETPFLSSPLKRFETDIASKYIPQTSAGRKQNVQDYERNKIR